MALIYIVHVLLLKLSNCMCVICSGRSSYRQHPPSTRKQSLLRVRPRPALSPTRQLRTQVHPFPLTRKTIGENEEAAICERFDFCGFVIRAECQIFISYSIWRANSSVCAVIEGVMALLCVYRFIYGDQIHSHRFDSCSSLLERAICL